MGSFIVFVSILLALQPSLVASQPVLTGTGLKVEIIQEGVALISEEFYVPAGHEKAYLSLFASPEGPSPKVMLSDGKELRYRLEGTNISIESLKGGQTVTVVYYTQDLTYKNGSVWTLKIEYGGNITIVLPSYAEIVFISPEAVQAKGKDNRTIAQLPPGSWEIRYTLNIVSLSSTYLERNSERGQQEGVNSGNDVPVGIEGGSIILSSIAFSLLAVVTLTLLALRRSSAPEIINLKPEEKRIIGILESKGGEAFQSEITRLLGLPKTTAWRYVKRLEEKGMVIVEKLHGMNYVRLRRR